MFCFVSFLLLHQFFISNPALFVSGSPIVCPPWPCLPQSAAGYPHYIIGWGNKRCSNTTQDELW